jgi:hypothetical protein
LEPYAAVVEFEQFERDWFACYSLQS